MVNQAYLIDTHVIIGLEDNKAVEPTLARFSMLAAKHKVDVFIHESAADDIMRDKDKKRRAISLSKIAKFQKLERVHGLTRAQLEAQFGPLRKDNDVVDMTLLHAVQIGAVDFLVTEDRRNHDRARRFSAELGRRVLFVADALQLLRTTFEPKDTPIKYVEEVSAHTISEEDPIFESLKEDYKPFLKWWREKCVAKRRLCWVVYEGDALAGLIVRKDERPGDTDASLPGEKILKVCTFKVRPESRGTKLGELLLKQVFWYAQLNNYDVAYLTTFERQRALIDLLESYGFSHTRTLDNGECVYERQFLRDKLLADGNEDLFQLAKINYPRFVSSGGVEAFGIPIKADYHDVLFPDLRRQLDMFKGDGAAGPRRPGNTIRKVYLCRAPSMLGLPGSLLFFYKGKSNMPPSQSVTAVGVLEDLTLARSTKELARLAGGRSVYSEKELESFKATEKRPVKVINFLLNGYVEPPISLRELTQIGVFQGHPAQSIFRIKPRLLQNVLGRLQFGFEI